VVLSRSKRMSMMLHFSRRVGPCVRPRCCMSFSREHHLVSRLGGEVEAYAHGEVEAVGPDELFGEESLYVKRSIG